MVWISPWVMPDIKQISTSIFMIFIFIEGVYLQFYNIQQASYFQRKIQNEWETGRWVQSLCTVPSHLSCCCAIGFAAPSSSRSHWECADPNLQVPFSVSNIAAYNCDHLHFILGTHSPRTWPVFLLGVKRGHQNFFLCSCSFCLCNSTEVTRIWTESENWAT